jgi:virginiamycin B lyase
MRLGGRSVRTLAIAAGLLIAAGAAIAGWWGVFTDHGVVEYPMRQQTDIPAAVAVARDGTVWFTIEFSDTIGRLRDGRIETFPKGKQNVEPLGLAVDAAGFAWYTDGPMRAISQVSPEGAITSFALSTPIARLARLAVAPDGAVWFADGTTFSVTRLKDGVFTPHDLGQVFAAPFGVAAAADGTVWATVQNTNKLVRIAPSGEMVQLDPPSRAGGLGDVAVDAHGAVWFVEMRANKVGRYADGTFAEFTVPTPRAGLTALAVAPDGAVWFTELRAGKLGRLRHGVVTEFTLPRRRARPFGIAVDGASNVWYTDLGGWLGMLPAERARAR